MSFREKIAFYLEDVESPIGLIVNLIVVFLIFLSLAMFVAETYSIPTSVRIWLQHIDWAILLIFTGEYLLRFWCTENKLKFIFSLFSLIDLIAIIPLFMGIMDTRFIRVFRWFRLLRIIRFIDIEISF